MIVRKNHLFPGLWSMLLVGCSVPPGAHLVLKDTSAPDKEMVPHTRVDHVIDGDTIIVTTRAGRSRVRLLGINAPEDAGRPGCFGARATTELRRLLPAGSKILLIHDRRRLDPYGRRLGYVWRADGVFVNEAMIRGGFAITLFLPPDIEFRSEFADAQDAARREQAGLWRACPAQAADPSAYGRWSGLSRTRGG